MKPARFRYVAATSGAEAATLLSEYGSDAQLLAGGQSLMPLLNRRLVRPAVLVDISGADDLQQLTSGPAFRIGAGVRQAQLEGRAEISREIPLLKQALAWVGSIGTKTRGTIGGSAAFADPAAEVPAALSALDAEFVATSHRGERVIAAPEFFAGAFRTSMKVDELLTEIRVAPMAAAERSCFVEVARRRGGSRAIVGVAVVCETGVDRVCKSVRIALSGMSDTPVRAYAAEQMLTGATLDGDLLIAAGEEATAGLQPATDVLASSDSRRAIATALVVRALTKTTEQTG